MATNPVGTYRQQQGMKPVAGSYSPQVVDWIKQAAHATGADPVALLATALQESNAQLGRVGDNGSSYGPFQHHRGGALGSHDSAWANSYAAVLERATQFAKYGVRGGKGAAAVQRPFDQLLYAKGVDSLTPKAKQILGAMLAPQTTGGREAASPTTTGAPAVVASSGSGINLFSLAKSVLGGISDKQLDSYRAKLRPVNVDIPAAAASVGLPKAGVSIVRAAQRWAGTPYSWGGGSTAGPSKGTGRGAGTIGFDCSSLLQYAASKAGVSIGRTTYQQWQQGKVVPEGQLQAGDAVFFHMGSGGPGHVGIYVGNGTFIHAPHTGDHVKISKLAGYPGYVGSRRYI